MGKKSLSSDFLFAQPSAVAGISRFFDCGGCFDDYNISATPDEADAKAMYADWAIVGEAIQFGMCKLKPELDEAEKAA